MSIIFGLVLGIGLMLIWWSFWPQEQHQQSIKLSKAQDLIASSGISYITVPGVIVLALLLGLFVFVLFSATTGAVPIGLSFGIFAAASPWAVLAWHAKRRQKLLQEVWPDAIDNLRSAVRAGLTLPEALAQLATRGPVELQGEFESFALDYRAGASFETALDNLKNALADPIADRLVAALKVTREVGGADIGRLLETFSDFLRDDGRMRAELQARQSWTVNGARLAVIAPWVILLLLSTQQEAAAAYRSFSGLVILLGGMVVTVVCYQLMLRIGALPAERRVL